MILLLLSDDKLRFKLRVAVVRAVAPENIITRAAAVFLFNASRILIGRALARPPRDFLISRGFLLFPNGGGGRSTRFLLLHIV